VDKHERLRECVGGCVRERERERDQGGGSHSCLRHRGLQSLGDITAHEVNLFWSFNVWDFPHDLSGSWLKIVICQQLAFHVKTGRVKLKYSDSDSYSLNVIVKLRNRYKMCWCCGEPFQSPHDGRHGQGAQPPPVTTHLRFSITKRSQFLSLCKK